jgi:transposase
MTKIHWSKEKRDEVREAYAKDLNAEEVARTTGVPVSTVRRFCKDITKDPRNVKAVRLDERSKRIAAMRKESRELGKADLSRYAVEEGLSEDAISNALRGRTFKHVNAVEAPFIVVVKKNKERDAARDLYQQGLTYNAIAERLSVSKSSVSLWCSDLVVKKRASRKVIPDSELVAKARELYATGLSTLKVSTQLNVSNRKVAQWCEDLVQARVADRSIHPIIPKKKIVAKNASLTDEFVVNMRRTVRRTGVRNWPQYAKEAKASITVISMAARGESYKHLNDIEAPITEADIKVVSKPRKNVLDPAKYKALVEKMAELRREDPLKWTYSELAKYMSVETKRKYRGSHIAITLRNFDPTLKELEAIKPAPVPRVKKAPAAPKARKVLSVEELKRRADLKRFMAEADAFEREHPNGLP